MNLKTTHTNIRRPTMRRIGRTLRSEPRRREIFCAEYDKMRLDLCLCNRRPIVNGHEMHGDSLTTSISVLQYIQVDSI